MRILIVEDNLSVRKLIRRMITESAEQIVEREDGAEAVTAYELYLPDIVLMDVKMPHMDGLTATRELLNRFPLAKILIVTDYDDDGLRRAARECGACGFALKSNLMDLEELINSVTK